MLTWSGTEVDVTLDPPLARSPLLAAGSVKPSSAPTRPAELTCDTLYSSCEAEQLGSMGLARAQEQCALDTRRRRWAKHTRCHVGLALTRPPARVCV